MAELKGNIEANNTPVIVTLNGIGARGEKGKDGRDGKDGKDGSDYIITSADYAEIASMVDVSDKADKSALDETNSLVETIWKMLKGIAWNWQTVRSQAKSVVAPNGTLNGEMLELGGMTIKPDGTTNLVDAPVDGWTIVKSNGSSTTIALPQAVIDRCPDYGAGVSAECYNYIDFSTKTYHRKVIKQALGETVKNVWSKSSSYRGGYYATCYALGIPFADFNGGKNPIANKLTFATSVSNYKAGTFLFDGSAPNLNFNVRFWENDSVVSSASGFAEYLHTLYEQGDPLIICYALYTEQTIDLSDVLDDDIVQLAVKSGDSVTFHYPQEDAYDIAVPNAVNYLVNLSEDNT